MTNGERITGLQAIIDAAIDDQQSGVKNHHELAWAERFNGNGFNDEIMAFILQQGIEVCMAVYQAAWKYADSRL